MNNVIRLSKDSEVLPQSRNILHLGVLNMIDEIIYRKAETVQEM